MKALICDRCGEYINTQKAEYMILKKNRMSNMPKLLYMPKEYDLCPKCMEEFEQFLEEKRNV